MPALILFDIDGTLLSSHGAGMRAMNDAFESCFGVRDAFEGVAMAGCTDPWIFRQAYAKFRVAEPFAAALARFDRTYHDALPAALAGVRVSLKPNLPALLEKLATRADVALGILSGNFELGAQLKLRACRIESFFTAGAYGSDDEDRNRLVPHAIRRFADRGRSFRASETIVIGDTPRDIACARAGGARAVAVATGGHRIDELRRHEPDLALESLAREKELLGLLS